MELLNCGDINAGLEMKGRGKGVVKKKRGQT